MTPRHIGDAILYCGDFRDVLPELPRASADAVICDPPYGCTDNEWDAEGTDFPAFWQEVLGVARQNAAFCVCGQQPFFTDLVASNRRMFRYELIWKKPRPASFLLANKMPMRGHENIGIFYRALPTYHPQKRPGRHVIRKQGTPSANYRQIRHRDDFVDRVVDGHHPTTLLLEIDGAGLAHTLHPTQKPQSLMAWLIRTYTDRGDVVLDPFMGSGTTGAAALETGRGFIGVERNPEYFEIACERLRKIADRPSLLKPDTPEDTRARAVTRSILEAVNGG